MVRRPQEIMQTIEMDPNSITVLYKTAAQEGTGRTRVALEMVPVALKAKALHRSVVHSLITVCLWGTG